MATMKASEEQVREVVDAVRTSDIPRAIELARGFLAAGAQHPMFLNLRAYWHESQGRLSDAFDDLEAARRLAPTDAIILNAYGLCATRLGKTEEALAAFEAAASSDPNFFQAHFNVGWAAEGLGDLDRARQGYLRAVELAPTSAEALGSLAWLYARTARWEDARATADLALGIAPNRPTPMLALATVSLNTGDVPGAERHVRAVLSLPQVSRLDRGIALGLLGDCLDRKKNWDGAFEAYTQSNTLFRDEYAGQVAARSRESMSSMLDWLTSYFKAASPVAWQSKPKRVPDTVSAGHAFLVGFPRSGTTLLEQVLAAHPSIITMDEKEVLSDSVREFMRSPATLDELVAAEDSRLANGRRRYWERVEEQNLNPEGKVFIDKLPLNLLKLPLISRLFPDAKILLAIRDPRDVVWGCFRQRFQMNAAMLEFTTLEGTARFYDRCMGLLDAYMRTLGLNIHTIRHETLVSDFDNEARKAIEFLGVPWDEGVRSFSERARERAISTPSAVQVARGLYASGGQWKRYERHMRPILPTLQPWVDRFGYPD